MLRNATILPFGFLHADDDDDDDDVVNGTIAVYGSIINFISIIKCAFV